MTPAHDSVSTPVFQDLVSCGDPNAAPQIKKKTFLCWSLSAYSDPCLHVQSAYELTHAPADTSQ